MRRARSEQTVPEWDNGVDAADHLVERAEAELARSARTSSATKKR